MDWILYDRDLRSERVNGEIHVSHSVALCKHTYRGQLIHECAHKSFMTMVTNMTKVKILSIVRDLVECLPCRDDLCSKATF